MISVECWLFERENVRVIPSESRSNDLTGIRQGSLRFFGYWSHIEDRFKAAK